MLISIISINYNNKNGLEATIQSVRNQHFKDFEYIIIDGGSDDGSAELIQANKAYLNYWISEKDSGVYNAMNKGIKASEGKYLLFLNSGDTLAHSNTLEHISKYLASDKDIYYGDLEVVNGTEKEIKTYPNELSFLFFYNKGHIPHPASFIKKALFDKVYLYKEKFKIVSDWDFFVCAICKHNASYQHVDLVISNYQLDGLSSSEENFALIQQERQLSIQDNFPMFITDANRLIEYDKKFKLNRFKILSVLEEIPIAKKLNSGWLKLLSILFGKKIN